MEHRPFDDVFPIGEWGFPIATWGFSLSGNVSIPHHPRDSDPTPERSFSAFVCLPSLRRVWWHGFFSLTHFYPSQNAQNITKFQCTFILDTGENLYHKYSRKVGQTFTPLWSTVTCNQNAALYITPFENAKHFPTTVPSGFDKQFLEWCTPQEITWNPQHWRFVVFIFFYNCKCQLSTRCNVAFNTIV